MKKYFKVFSKSLPIATIFLILSSYVSPILGLIDLNVLGYSLLDTVDVETDVTHSLTGWSSSGAGAYGSDPRGYRHVIEETDCTPTGIEASVTMNTGSGYAEDVMISHYDNVTTDAGFNVYLDSVAPGNLIGTYVDDADSGWITTTFALPSYPTGSLTFIFEATGAIDPTCGIAGQVAVSTITLMGSANPTVPTITAPANGSVHTTAALTMIDWTDSTVEAGPAEYQYRAFNDVAYTSVRYTSGWLATSEIPTPGTPEQDYYIQVRARDANGVETAWSNGAGNPYKITVDNTPPVATVTSHTDGDTVSGSIVVNGTVTDLNLSHYWAVVHEGSSMVPGLSTGAGQLGYGVVYTSEFTDQPLFTWDTTQVDDGTYTIKLEARDLAGNKDPNAAPVLSDPESATDSIDWVTVTVDNAPEATHWVAPTAPAFFTRLADGPGNQINMMFEENPAADIDHYEYQYNAANLDGTSKNTGITTMSGVSCVAGTCTWSPNFFDGRLNIHRFRAVDAAGNKGAWSNYTALSESDFGAVSPSDYTYDNYDNGTGVFVAGNGYVKAHGGFAIREQVLPESTITSPAGGITNNPFVDVDYTANDVDTEVKKVELWYSYEGSSYAHIATDSDVDGSFDQIELTDGNGTYCFYTIAEDIADDLTQDLGVGNRELPPVVACELEIELDLIEPYSLFTSPADDSFWNTAIPLEGISEDDETYVDFVTLYWGDFDTSTWTQLEIINNPSMSNPFVWATTWTPSEGVYDFMVQATDAAGNVESTDYVLNVTFDITPPEVPTDLGFNVPPGNFATPRPNVEIPCGGYTNQNAVSMHWTDESASGAVEYMRQWQWPGSSAWQGAETWTTPYTNYRTFGGNPGTEGTWHVRVRARDAAGNWSAWSSGCAITFDETPPVVDITSHDNGDVLELTETITGEIVETNLSHYNLSLYPDPTGTCDVESTWNFSNRIWQRSGSTNSLSHDLDTTQITDNYGDGHYMIRLAARDLAGNRDPMASTGTGVSVDVICVTIDNSGSISGIKYEDVNNNGAFDSGEPTLEGWKVYIDLNGNNRHNRRTEPFAITDVDGKYTIDGLAPNQTYTVRETLKNGWMQTEPGGNHASQEHSVFVDYAEDVTDVQFGNFKLGMIQGRKYTDHNMNGVHNRNQGETRLDGWTINLFKRDRGRVMFVDSRVTGHTGNIGQYRFRNLTPGIYYVCEEQQSGWRQTGPRPGMVHNGSTAVRVPRVGSVCWRVDIDESRDNNTGLKFGNFELAQVSGVKWSDLDADGEKDRGEYPLRGWAIVASRLVITRFGPIFIPVRVDITDRNGEYDFELPLGIYRIWELPRVGWQQTAPTDPNFYTVIVRRSGMEFMDRDFLNTELGSISGMKFEDDNHNGQYDDGENALEGWDIYLYNEEDLPTNDVRDIEFNVTASIAQIATTDEFGQYSFDDLVTGTYYVCEENREGWEQTLPNDITGYATPDVTDDIAEKCYMIELAAGEDVEVDFGNFELAIIEGMKWEDVDIDGNMDDGESGLDGWEITLDGNVVDVTSDGGFYTITDVRYGEHEVCEVMKDGWVQSSSPECYTINVDGSGLLFEGNDFGNYFDLFPTVTLSANPGTSVQEGTVVTLNASHTDGNTPMQSPTYSWSGDCSGSGSSKTLPSTPGTYTCSVEVTDLDGDSATDTISVTVTANPPVIVPNGQGGPGGIGDTGPEILGEDTEEGEEEGDVLGELTCDVKQKVSGNIYFDRNNNESKDEDEDGAGEVELELVATIDGEEVVVETVTTDENGYWEAEVCPGNYDVRVKKDSLPDNATLVGDDILGITVAEGSDLGDVNFELDEDNGGFNWWICLIPLIIFLLLLLTYIFASRRSRSEESF